MIDDAAVDAGPIIHLEQINQLEILNIIDKILVSREVANEVGKQIIDNIDPEVEELSGESKDRAKYLCSKHNIELGEATTISLAQQRNINMVFTDDLDARQAAKRVEMEPHGTLSIVTRAYSENLLTQEEAKETVENLRKKSSLFLTSDLVKWAKTKIEEETSSK